MYLNIFYHYLYYVYKKRDLSLRNAYRYFIKNKKKMLSLSRKERNKIYGGFVIFHGIEFLILLFLLSLISEYFLYILIGCAFHLFSDLFIYFQIYYLKKFIGIEQTSCL